jgi:RNA polymerase sigma-70 factor (ECF subfamily)
VCSNVVVVDRANRQVVDDRAFVAMYERELHVLTALGVSMTGDRDLGADLAQEAMSRAYRSWDMVGALDRPGAWTRRVLINLAIDAHRRAARESRSLRLVGTEPVVVASERDADRFWQAVRALPDRQRAAVALHYIDDLSVAEVADILEITAGTVKTSLHMARRNLAAALRAEEVSDDDHR